jgi:hypothetical protein
MKNLKQRIINTVAYIAIAGPMAGAIEFSPGAYHMDAYQRACSVLAKKGKVTKDSWNKVYEFTGIKPTKWAGFDLTTEQLNEFVNSKR